MVEAPKKTATIYQWIADPTQAGLGKTRARVAEVMTADAIPGRVFVPAGGAAARVRRVPERLVTYEKRGAVGIITARVENVGDLYDEIDALLDRIERDEEIHVVAIYGLNGLFASLPIRWRPRAGFARLDGSSSGIEGSFIPILHDVMVSYEAAGQVKMLLEMEKEIKQADARPKQNAKEGGGRK